MLPEVLRLLRLRGLRRLVLFLVVLVVVRTMQTLADLRALNARVQIAVKQVVGIRRTKPVSEKPIRPYSSTRIIMLICG